MNGGWKIPAAAALLVGGVAFTPAQAADLGGDCCADLEERVAELEATTVRKGNRKVSLKVSGFVSKSVMFWDDGTEDDVYVSDTNGGTLSSNFSFSGAAQINSDWSAGYNIVIEAPGGSNLTAVDQTTDDAGGGITTLVSAMYLKSNTYGKLSWGLQSQATDNTALLVDLSGTIIQSNYVQFHGGSFILKQGGAALDGVWLNMTPCGGLGAGVALDCHGLITDNVRYDSPTIAGFSVSTSWGEDDFWDVAVNYAGKLGDVKVKAAYGFTNFSGEYEDSDYHQVGASILHVPSGIFLYGAYGTEDADDATVGTVYTEDGFFGKAGIQLSGSSLGKTIIWGEYQYNESRVVGAVSDEDYAEYDGYGVGVVQYIDAASMQLHAMWKRKEGELDAAGAADLGGAEGDLDELDMFIVGGTIFF